MERIKLYCIFAKEPLAKMKGVRGKLASMAGHAYVHSVWDSMDRFPEHFTSYRASPHAYKITLVVDTVAELVELENAYRDRCGVSLVTDAGFTVFDGPTTISLGVGPIPESLVGDDIKSLKTLT